MYLSCNEGVLPSCTVEVYGVDMASAESSNPRCLSLHLPTKHSRERCPLDRDAAIAMAGDNETKGPRRIQLLKRLKRRLHGLKQDGINLEASSIGQSSQVTPQVAPKPVQQTRPFIKMRIVTWSTSLASPFTLSLRGITRYEHNSIRLGSTRRPQPLWA
jgi:hypothetical protein